MAVIVQVSGLATIQVGTGSEQALETLGYTQNGVEITFEGFFLDVPGDENGGDEGPPVDVQNLGEIARIRLELTKWDLAIANKVVCRELGGAVGVIATPGSLMFGDTKTYRLAIACPATGAGLDYDFPRAFPRMPIEVNRGTKFAKLIMEWEAHKLAPNATPTANLLFDNVVPE